PLSLPAMTKVTLNRKISQRVANGHPWVFANEVNRVDGNAEAGAIVDVHTHDDKFLGRGYINPKSQILVRILTRKKNEEINDDFFLRKLTEAWKQRQQMGYNFMSTLPMDKRRVTSLISRITADILSIL
ncbi:MAG TPA: PUA domain-containing protein, partial [Lacibacter sp.]|nr:PUA domain-containing protein [Lacibacter sp.]